MLHYSPADLVMHHLVCEATPEREQEREHLRADAVLQRPERQP
jgi:hypothetical protein